MSCQPLQVVCKTCFYFFAYKTSKFFLLNSKKFSLNSRSFYTLKIANWLVCCEKTAQKMPDVLPISTKVSTKLAKSASDYGKNKIDLYEFFWIVTSWLDINFHANWTVNGRDIAIVLFSTARCRPCPQKKVPVFFVA